MDLRRYRAEDLPALSRLFGETVRRVNIRDYTPAQAEAWAAGEGRCVVGVLHDVNLALNLADLFLLMEEGQARYFGPSVEFDPAALNRVFQMDVGGYMRRSLTRWEELK